MATTADGNFLIEFEYRDIELLISDLYNEARLNEIIALADDNPPLDRDHYHRKYATRMAIRQKLIDQSND